MSENGKIVDAYAEWDDRHEAFCVFIVREDEDGNPDRDNAKPMEAVHDIGDEHWTPEGRLYRAAFVRHPKAFQGENERTLGWNKEATAERVARAVKREIARMHKGEPPPSAFAVQVAMATLPRRR